MHTIGCDPEFFLCIDGDEVISPALLQRAHAIEFVIPDLKHPVLINTGDFKFHMDGVAVELGLNSPCESFLEMYYILKNALDELKYYSEQISYEDKKLSLVVKPVVNINPDKYTRFMGDPLIYQGFIFGCDPDEDLDDSQYVCKTLDVATHPYRYGGGHIHIGNKKFNELYRPSISLLTITIGTFCVANSLFPELDRQRVKTYGKPRRYRLQNYPNGDKGVEYRSPSNSWTLFSKEQFEEMGELVDKAEYLLDHEEEGSKFIKEYLEYSKSAIVEYNINLAKEIQEKIM